MRYLLDTDVISETSKSNPDRRVQKWWDANYLQSGVSSLTIGELWRGILRLPEGEKKKHLEERVLNVEELFELSMADPSRSVMKTWAKYVLSLEAKGHDFKTIPVVDSVLAATALEYSLTVVTRNEKDFPDVPVFNPWT